MSVDALALRRELGDHVEVFQAGLMHVEALASCAYVCARCARWVRFGGYPKTTFDVITSKYEPAT